jgi:hypothetical protein
LGYFSRKFQALLGYKPSDPHNVGKMTTHELPIPNVGGDRYYVQFTVECHGDGSWTLEDHTNCTLNTTGLKEIRKTLVNIHEKIPHLYKNNGDIHYDIESIFVILQELEDAFINYNPKNKALIENKEIHNTHFSHVLKILPEEMQENIILRIERSKNSSVILKPRKINRNIVLPGHKPPSN